MSKLEVDKIDPQSGTALEIGTSGDTVTIPSGVTLDASNATTSLPATVVTTTGTQTLTNKSIATTQLTGTITPSDSTVSLAKLTATGTKNATTFLRGDNTFASVSVNNGLELLATTTISSDASISFDSSLITDTYKSYKLILQNIRVATDNVYILVQVSSDNGSNYITSGYSRMVYYILSTGSPGSASGDGNKSGFYANGSFAVGNDTGEGLDSDVTLFGLRSTTTAKTFIHQTIGIQNNGVPAMEQGGFILPNTTAMNNIKIYASSGNLASGEVKLYGFS